MFIGITNSKAGDTKAIAKQAHRMHINILKKAIAFIKFSESICEIREYRKAIIQRFKALNQITYTEITPQYDCIKVECNKVTKEEEFIIKYISYFLK